jgi:hypothetical protein
MGRDAMSVVDAQLRVYGIDGLRIADASIMPRGGAVAPEQRRNSARHRAFGATSMDNKE